MLQRIIITTSEGTKTLQIPEWDECYHSHHGILQEASHVFIKNGFDLIDKKEISVLEMGFGTGLNALLTLKRAIEKKIKVSYYTLEKYPVSFEELQELDYGNIVSWPEAQKYYQLFHQSPWGRKEIINEYFEITKYQIDFFQLETLPVNNIDIVYYDAFGARVQPELWEEDIFKQIYGTMNPHSLLTTYSSKGSARRAMQQAGFRVEKKQGPKGKREMVNAWKEDNLK